MPHLSKIAFGTFALIIAAAITAPAQAQQAVESVYRGKQMEMIIGYSPGGTYDLYARLVARFLGNYIPGKPVIVPRNMPGAGSRAAVKWVSSIGPKDGTILATADQSLSVEQAMGDKQLDFDTTKLVYIGNPNADNNTTATWYTSGVKTIEDAKLDIVRQIRLTIKRYGGAGPVTERPAHGRMAHRRNALRLLRPTTTTISRGSRRRRR